MVVTLRLVCEYIFYSLCNTNICKDITEMPQLQCKDIKRKQKKERWVNNKDKTNAIYEKQSKRKVHGVP